MKKFLAVILAIFFVAAAVIGIRQNREAEEHKYDQYLVSPEMVLEQCLQNMGDQSNPFVETANLYRYFTKRIKEAGPQPPRIAELFNQNLLLEKTDSPYRFNERVRTTLWQLRYCEFSEPEKILLEYEDEVCYRVKASSPTYNQELWIRMNQVSNGLWYVSEFANYPPYDWDGNAPLTEKNKVYAEKLIQEITDEDICQMFVHASAAKQTDRPGQKSFLSPAQLDWESYLNFTFGSMDEKELDEAYDEDTKSYIFVDRQIGLHVWNYLGSDEYENDALGSYGYPHGSQIAKEYSIRKSIYSFPEEMVRGVETFHPEFMEVTNREVLDNGRAVFEIAYEDTESEPAIINRQRIEVRAMESGYRYLSYIVIEPGKESEGNRFIERFIERPWKTAGVQHCTYEAGNEEPTQRTRWLSSDFDDLRESLRQLKIGAELDIEDLPENARVMDVCAIESEYGRQTRKLDLYSFEADGQWYILVRTCYLTMTVGEGSGSVSISINNTPISQQESGEEYVLCHLEDYQQFQDIVMEVLGSE